jgi:mono/diheme cytochrome c family protein
MTRRLAGSIGAIAVAGVATAMWLATATPAAAQASSQPGANAPMGAYLFKTYCASCHGVAALGNGPLADSMRRRPSNLTEIAKRNKGAYSREMVFRIIDGRTPVRGHGGPDMPVWGDAFMRTSDTADEASVRARIQALVEFLESIQARDGF